MMNAIRFLMLILQRLAGLGATLGVYFQNSSELKTLAVIFRRRAFCWFHDQILFEETIFSNAPQGFTHRNSCVNVSRRCIIRDVQREWPLVGVYW